MTLTREPILQKNILSQKIGKKGGKTLEELSDEEEEESEEEDMKKPKKGKAAKKGAGKKAAVGKKKPPNPKVSGKKGRVTGPKSSKKSSKSAGKQKKKEFIDTDYEDDDSDESDTEEVAVSSSRSKKKKVKLDETLNLSLSVLHKVERSFPLPLVLIEDELRRSCRRFCPRQIHWSRIILDEAHYIKERRCNTAKSIFALTSDFKWCLTGTPLQNRVSEVRLRR